MLFHFSAQSASGILHALNNMRQQEQTGNFHPSRNLQQSQHTQMQVITQLVPNLDMKYGKKHVLNDMTLFAIFHL